MAIGAAVFFLLADRLVAGGVLSGGLNLAYLSTVGFLVGYLLSARLARSAGLAWRYARQRLGHLSPEAVRAAGSGTAVALIVTVLFNVLLEAVPGFSPYWSLLIAASLVTLSSWFFVANRGLFVSPLAPNATRSMTKDAVGWAPARPKVVDTSAIIDGRVVNVVGCHFIEGVMLIPHFVLGELQHIADSDDKLRRRRGRRGLEVLDRLIKQPEITTRLTSQDFPELSEVDAKLLRLCEEHGADLITTDFNLDRVAALKGIRVLNVNALANAVKSVFMPGAALSLHVVKEGSESGQGLAYLEDGTMVVIEDAARFVGSTVEASVTSNLQTNMGRMVFARLRNTS
ncbi:MAG: PIN domain nuclease [Deinococcota bacterium]|nr:PIN domain nuclease [Deinococcota bacterium]